MKRSGSADLPLHYGHVPPWLSQRMAKLGLAITESIITEYGSNEFLVRMANPFWFQSLGAVMGMDWHSSGITTSVMGALKRALNPHARELGIYICGGKGKFSRETPNELIKVADKTGLDGKALVHCSKLSAKVDNTAVQDGFQLYLHNFIVSSNGEWTVVQQGMHENNKTARRYHWHSGNLQSFTEVPHSGICGINQGAILNLTAISASSTKKGILDITAEKPDTTIRAFQRLIMPAHHHLKATDVNIKKLGAVLWLAHEQQPKNFDELLSLQGVGPRTIQSLALVSEVIHGTPSRFEDPARYSFAHGGKDGHPFPVPVRVYDETIHILQDAVSKAKLGHGEKAEAIKKLHIIASRAEENFTADGTDFEKLVQDERDNSWRYGGRTVFGETKKPKTAPGDQLQLF
jgi:hypothetical protein